MRERLTAAAGALEALLAYADPICREAYDAAEEYRVHRPSWEIDDCDMLLGHLTGWGRFEPASQRLEVMAACAGGDYGRGISDLTPQPDGYVRYGERRGRECPHPAWLYEEDGLVECPTCGVIRPHPDDTEEVQAHNA